MSTDRTQDQLQHAKDALMRALRTAEGEVTRPDLRRLEKIVAATEALQLRLRGNQQRKAKP